VLDDDLVKRSRGGTADALLEETRGGGRESTDEGFRIDANGETSPVATVT
jgi:hypothetical protein